MKKLLLLLLIIVAFVCLSCSHLSYGIVIEKEYVPSHVETYYVQVWTGKNSWMLIPETYTVEDKWFVTIENVQDNGDKKRATVEITELTYESLQLGQRFDVNNQ